ncbi:hypothetical protein PG994_005069 [Apiospora phragmitis]|uniref:NACHT domain-containing protein n=1 Tax=Apiospora phragmitis TaxID=2905665 RepID=A0ABR1VSE1_9PEZI
MASVSSSSLATTKQHDVLLDAIRDFQVVLSFEERRELIKMRTVPDADSIMAFTAELDSTHRTRRRPSCAIHLHAFLSSVGLFCGIVELVSSHAEIAALVWGSVKLTMLVSANGASYYQTTSDLFTKLGRLCPLFADYQSWYPDSIRLQKALVEFHASIIRCCAHIIRVIQVPALRQVIKALLVSFEDEFKPNLDDIQRFGKARDHLRQGSGRTTRTAFAGQTGKTQEFYDMQLQRDQRIARERKQHLLDSLSTRDYLRLFKQSCTKRWQNTASWIFQKPEFCSWLDGGKPVLWCSGKIGSGKTITTASIIQQILRCKGPSSGPVSYYFVRPSGYAPPSANGILKSILQQRLDPTNISDEMEGALRKLNRASDIDDTVDLLRQFVSPGVSYIIIDGLDEYPKSDRRDLFAALSSLLSSSSSIRLFLCGRTGLQDQIETHFKHCLHLPLEFLWAYFQVEVSSQPCDEGIRIALHNLPNTLNEIFNRALRRIATGRHYRVAQKVFKWVTAARRPLTIRELREATTIKVRQQYSDATRQCNDMGKISSWCENLVEMDEESETVQFVHHSVRIFLLEEPTDFTAMLDGFHIILDEADHELGEICLTYLDFNDFKRPLVTRPKPTNISPLGILKASSKHGSKLASLHKTVLGPGPKAFDLSRSVDPDGIATMTQVTQTMIDRYPFSGYATEHWVSHTKHFGVRKSKTWGILFQVLSGSYSFVKLPWQSNPPFQDNAAGWANRNRHGTIIRILCSDEPEVSFEWAAANDDLALFDILPNEVKYESPGKIFAYAASVGHVRAIEELVLSGKVHVNDAVEGTTALVATSCKERHDVIDNLMSLGTKANVSNGGYSSDGEVFRLEIPLIAAASRGYLGVFDRLQSYGADVNVATRDCTPLIAATSSNHRSLVERIVGAGASLEHTAGHHTALSKAAAKGYLDIVGILLAAGANVNGKADRNTALTRAVEHGHLHVDRLLAA